MERGRMPVCKVAQPSSSYEENPRGIVPLLLTLGLLTQGVPEAETSPGVSRLMREKAGVQVPARGGSLSV